MTSNNPMRPLQIRPLILNGRSTVAANKSVTRPSSASSLKQELEPPTPNNCFSSEQANRTNALSSQVGTSPMAPPAKLIDQIVKDEKKFVCRTCPFPIEFPTEDCYYRHIHLVHFNNCNALRAPSLKLRSESRSPSYTRILLPQTSLGRILSHSPHSSVPVYHSVNLTEPQNRRSRFRGGLQCIDWCNTRFETAYDLYLHVLGKHHGIVFICRACFSLFKSSSNLEAHISQEHVNDPLLPSPNENRPIDCSQCDSSFQDLPTLKRHYMAAHTRHRIYSDENAADSTKPLEKLPFSCLVCSKGFPVLNTLWLHIVSHPEFNNHRDRYWHFVGAEGEKGRMRKLARCYSCQRTFFGRGAYAAHLRGQHNVLLPKAYRYPHYRFTKRPQCQRCGLILFSKFSLFLHSRNHLRPLKANKPSVFCCRFCSQSNFLRISCFWRHLYDTHKFERRLGTENQYCCQACERFFPRKTSLDFHRKVHVSAKRTVRFHRNVRLFKKRKRNYSKKPSDCFLCERSFSTPHYLWRHVRAHPEFATKKDDIWRCFLAIQERNSPEIEYDLCEICHYCFVDPVNFDRHKRVQHPSLKPEEKFLRCYICKMAFSSGYSYRCHFLSVHGVVMSKLLSGNFESLVKCNRCGRKFSSTSSLVLHSRTHLRGKKRSYLKNPKASHCQFCSQSFSRISELWRHLKTHRGLAPIPTKGHQYCCNDCERSFVRWESLSFHLKSHEA